MPQKLDLEEIARKNPNIDLQKIEEWRRLGELLQKSGLRGRRIRNTFSRQEKRAKIVDDADSDPRLVSLKQ